MNTRCPDLPLPSAPPAAARAAGWALLAIASLSIFAACSSDDDPAPAPAPEATATREVRAADVPTYADFLSRDTALRCAQLGELCASFGQERSTTCDDVLPDDAHDPAAGGTYSAEGAAACLEERAARGLAGRLATEGPGEVLAGVASACDTVFRGPAFGTVALGERCTLQSDCAPLPGGRAQCVGFAPEPSFCRGTLAAKLGDRCNSKVEDGLPKAPSPDLLCDHVQQRYVAVPALGEACVDGACGPAGTCVDEICIARLALGSPCQTNDVCASNRCEAGACAAFGKRGDACANSSDCASAHCAAGRCERSYTYRYVCE